MAMIRKLKSGGYRLYSRKINPKTGRRRNLGTFLTRAEAEKHERTVQYFKRTQMGRRRALSWSPRLSQQHAPRVGKILSRASGRILTHRRALAMQTTSASPTISLTNF
jgi:hypothetical protein